MILRLSGWYGLSMSDVMTLSLYEIASWIDGARRRERYEARRTAILTTMTIAPHTDKNFRQTQFAKSIAARDMPEAWTALAPFELYDDEE